MNFAEKFAAAVSYESFLDAHGTAEHRRRWSDFYARCTLTTQQRDLLAGFKRQMNVLCLAGAWCGDCVNQCPIFQRFAEAGPRIDLRFLDRDVHADVQAELSLCGGNRVPVLVFLSEDYHECGRYGDRPLSKYRQMAIDQLGPACPTGIIAPSAELIRDVTADWLREFERVQLMLRLSARLRQKHGD